MALETLQTTIIKLLQNAFGTQFNAYFYGDPVEIGKSNLPAIAVDKDSSNHSLGPTQMNYVTEKLIIKVMYDKRDDFGTDPTKDMTQTKIIDAIEARNDDGTLADKSVLGILTSHFALSPNHTLNQAIDINYGIVGRPDDSITSEGQVTITVRRLYEVPARNVS